MKHFALCLSNDFGEDFSGDDVLPGLVYGTSDIASGTLAKIARITGVKFTK